MAANKKHVRNILLILLILELIIILFGALIMMSIPGEHLSSQKTQNATTTAPITSTDPYGNVTSSNETVEIVEINPEQGPALYSDCVFFVITTITTVGYGNVVPNTSLGRGITVLLAFIGIPINIVFLAKIGIILKNFSVFLFNSMVKKLWRKWRKSEKGDKNQDEKELKELLEGKRFRFAQIMVFILLGHLFFVLIPAIIIMSFENWVFLDSFYFIFVTLFTIGYGDLVAGSKSEMSPTKLIFYRLCIYIWMYIGMAYIALVINLLLEYLGENAENIKKEILTIVDEKIKQSMMRYALNKRIKERRKSEQLRRPVAALSYKRRYSIADPEIARRSLKLESNKLDQDIKGSNLKKENRRFKKEKVEEVNPIEIHVKLDLDRLEESAYNRYYGSLSKKKSKKSSKDIEAGAVTKSELSSDKNTPEVIVLDELTKAGDKKLESGSVINKTNVLRRPKIDSTNSDDFLAIEINDINHDDLKETEKIYETVAQEVDNNIYYLGEEKKQDKVYDTFKIIHRNTERRESECSLQPGPSNLESGRNETPILAFSNELYDVVRRGSRRLSKLAKSTRSRGKSLVTTPTEFPVD